MKLEDLETEAVVEIIEAIMPHSPDETGLNQYHADVLRELIRGDE